MVGFIDTFMQLQAITIAHNQWLSKTSVPYWTTNVFCSAVTDLVLIYESITSSACVVRWLALHSWTLNCERLQMTTHECLRSYNSGRTEKRSLPPAVHLLLRLFVAARTCLQNRCPTMDYSASILCSGNVPSNGHIRHNIQYCGNEKKAHYRQLIGLLG
jgi:hypothetical protein